MLVLNEKQLKNLEALLDELPLKYARPILQLINSFAQENVADQQNGEAKENHQADADKKPAFEVEAE